MKPKAKKPEQAPIPSMMEYGVPEGVMEGYRKRHLVEKTKSVEVLGSRMTPNSDHGRSGGMASMREGRMGEHLKDSLGRPVRSGGGAAVQLKLRKKDGRS